MFSVKVTQEYINKKVYLCNASLITEVSCYRYSTINNSTRKCFSKKFSDQFCNLL